MKTMHLKINYHFYYVTLQKFYKNFKNNFYGFSVLKMSLRNLADDAHLYFRSEKRLCRKINNFPFAALKNSSTIDFLEELSTQSQFFLSQIEAQQRVVSSAHFLFIPLTLFCRKKKVFTPMHTLAL